MSNFQPGMSLILWHVISFIGNKLICICIYIFTSIHFDLRMNYAETKDYFNLSKQEDNFGTH